MSETPVTPRGATAASFVDRRLLLKTGAGLVIACHVPFPETRLGGAAFAAENAAAAANALNTWLHIAPDDTVTIYVARAEMGQGIYTSMPMLIAEELEADWSKIRVEPSPSAPAFNYTGAPFEVTGGSQSIRSLWDILLKIGATGREMLVAAAAKQWGVDASTLKAEKGVVIDHGGKRKLRYGELAAAAATLPPPANPRLKDKKAWHTVGKPIKRLDTPAKIAGAPLFGIDVAPEGVLYAAVRTSPAFGGDVANFDELDKGEAQTLVKIDGGIAVVADNWWRAQQVADKLAVKWTAAPTAGLDTQGAHTKLEDALKSPGVVANSAGDAALALGASPKKVTADYATPYLAHAPMEPLNCTAAFKDDGKALEVWIGTQSHTLTKKFAASRAALDPEQVTVHTTYLGGGFGRRAESDMVFQAIDCAKAVGKPVKVLWSREEDIRHDFYRPASACRLTAGLGKDGLPQAFTAEIANSSIMGRWTQFGGLRNNLDFTSVEGLADPKYDIPNLKVQWMRTELGVPVGFWRSVGSSHNAFFLEGFIDECAHAANACPLAYRIKLLKKKPRFAHCLTTVAKMAGWEPGKTPTKARPMGVAIAESFGSIVAQIAEIEVAKDGQLKVRKVWVAVDCGRIVNPDTVAAQMEGGVVYGLSAALYGAINLKDGAVVESNFHDYQMLRPDELPEIHVQHIVNDEAPGGVGEPGTPPIAPAVVNALFIATGKRIRSLPLKEHKLI